MAKTRKNQAATEGKTNQAKAARTALQVRDEFITSLEACKSNTQFLEILNKYNSDKKKGVFSIGIFTSKQHGKITDADAEINTLIKQRRIYFAQQVRTDLIHSLEACTSYDRLLEILDEYDQGKEEKIYKINLNDITEKQYAVIQQLDLEISTLIESKTKQFAPELDGIDEKIEVKPEYASMKSVPEEISPSAHEHVPNPKSQIKKPCWSAFYAGKTGQVDIDRLTNVVIVRDHLRSIYDKKAEFWGKLDTLRKTHPEEIQKVREYQDAIKALDNIYEGINGLYQSYITREIDLDQFKSDAKVYLSEDCDDVQILKSHRGVKQILVNLLAFFLTGGVGYGIAALAAGRLMLFNPLTSSAQKTDNLLQSIEMVCASPVA